MTDLLVWLVLALLAGAVGAEAVAWCRPLQRFLLRKAAAVLPRQHAERYVEEWYGELEELPDGPITRLLWVTTLVLRRAALARALGAPRAVVGFTGGLKRVLDFSIAAIAIVMSGPLLLIIAAAIKVYDGGPVISQQMRIGRDGRPFTMLKFRSEGLDGGRKSLSVVPLGPLLRGSSLDDLPQLFNVLAGSMSLVGPHANEPEGVARTPTGGESCPLVKPGLTSPGRITRWQIGGDPCLDDLTAELVNRVDMHYVKRWSLALDLRILFRTLSTRTVPLALQVLDAVTIGVFLRLALALVDRRRRYRRRDPGRNEDTRARRGGAD